MVLLVDELSEFLRSKTDPHAYNEDIRFLQYLGEEASSFPLWVVASLQEWIEETGEINQDTFNKIKDRYPLRISLGRSHIEELVSHRLIRHREGCEGLFTKFSNRCGAIFLLFRLRKRGFPSSTRSIRPPSLSWTASSPFFPNIGASWISSTTG